MPKDPTGRALQLLSLLQTHRFWSGVELARRLEITGRTVRRDVDRLRALGYPISATSGKHGGYRLESGAHLPPLVLDDEEAVAVAVGLRHASQVAVHGIEDAAVRALATIEQLLPHRLRRRVEALQVSLAPAAVVTRQFLADPEALSVLAAACRDREAIRLEYRSREGDVSRRLVHPHQLVSAQERWYLVAWDHDRADWRTFRVDRIRSPQPTGGRFSPRDVPGGDASAFVANALNAMPRAHTGTIAVATAAEEISDALLWVDHTIKETGRRSSVIEVRGDDRQWLVLAIARIALTAPVTAVHPKELADAVDELRSRLACSRS
ncbi:YafY family protein [Demequina sp. NBRC 110053]|uniref:helix-turn-helix transcriptional regulator n=1 Tax=Demequina sp. NBRC 110053 TaxID=1570342 RepID=UPI0009FFB094|nr:YafY family protein [Demequina sp. NBRC 110053]